MDQHQGLHRVQSIYDWGSWEKIGIPVQSGILNRTRAADGYITVTVDRWARYLKTIDDQAFLEEDGKIDLIQTTKVMKEGAFVNDRNLKLINLMGLKYLVAEPRNLKFADHYYLAYPDSALLGSGGEVRREEDPARALYRFAGKAWGEFYFQAGDRLEMEVGPTRDQTFFAAVRESDGSRTLLFARRVNDKMKVPALNLVRTQAQGKLVFSAQGPRSEPASADLTDPAIVNADKYFKRLPVVRSFNIFENPDVMAPAFLTPTARFVSRPEALALLGDAGFDPRETALVEGPVTGVPARPLQPGEQVRVDAYDDGRVALTTKALVRRVMVLTDAYFPGWRVTVNGVEQRIRPADYAFRGVIVPPGQSRVEFWYQPASFRVGLWVFVAALLSIVIFSLVRLGRKRLQDGQD
jgi:hypothetical protein